MKSSCSLVILFISLFSINCAANGNDSSIVNKNFHNLEFSAGIAPKAINTLTANVHGLFGFNYDYSLHLKQNFFLGLIINPLHGKESYVVKLDALNQYADVRNKYVLANVGIALKYRLHLFNGSALNKGVTFSIGDLFSYKYIYQYSEKRATNNDSFPPPHYENIKLSNNYNNLRTFALSFPAIFKVAYYQKISKITCSFSFTEYIGSQEGSPSGTHLSRFYSSINVGIIL